jgi:methionyl-tRNA synthetase
MINKNCDGKIPEPGTFSEDDTALLAGVDGLLEVVREAMDAQSFHTALEKIWSEIRAANSYVDRQAPWTLKKEDPDRMKTVLYVLADAIRGLALITQPFVPEAIGKMLDQLSVGEGNRDFVSFGKAGRLAPGTELPKPEGVFPRHVEEETAA